MPASKKRKEGERKRQKEKNERDCLAAKQQLRALRLLTDLYESKGGKMKRRDNCSSVFFLSIIGYDEG